MKTGRLGLTLAVVRDLREARAPAGPELVAFETDVLAGFVLARAAAGLSDGTISSDAPGAGLGLVRLARTSWSNARAAREREPAATPPAQRGGGQQSQQ